MKDRKRQVNTLTIGIMIGFVMGITLSMTFLSWSTFILKDSNAESSRHLSIPDHKKSSKIKKKEYAGWKNIHVFYGDNSHISDATDLPTPYFKVNKWFAQYRQDEIVSRLLHGKRGGYFIDLAANDPVRISNTYALEKYFDWTGLCLEPNPVYWTGLSYRSCEVVSAVVGNRTMEEVLFRFPRNKALKGGILGEGFDNKSDKWNEGHTRFTVSLLEVFKKFNVPTIIDYISLDVEGAEDFVMSAFPFSKYRFNIITVERPSDTLSTILEANGYALLKTIKKNTETLWVHGSMIRHLDMSALDIDSQNYKYNDSTGHVRIIPSKKASIKK